MTKKHVNKRLIKFIAFILILLLIIIGFAIYFKSNVTPIVLDYSQASVQALGVNAVNQAALIVINDDLEYDDLFKIEHDNDNCITMIKANSPQINILARNMAMVTQNNLEAIGAQELDIPVGTFTGMNILTGHGPPICIKILPIGKVLCDFKSQFIQAGINQTVHKIYIDVLVNINIIMPIEEVEVGVNTEILICENLIVGKIPDVYLNTGGTSLDLNPN